MDYDPEMVSKMASQLPDKIMMQRAPWPYVLEELVKHWRYRPGWTFELIDMDRGQGSVGLTLLITAKVPDSYHLDQEIPIGHAMIVPAASYDKRSWRRWLFEQCRLVDTHEAMELARIVHLADYLGQDGNQYDQVERPYAPSHGPGNDPYMIREVGTVIDQRTSFRGEVDSPGHWRVTCGAGQINPDAVNEWPTEAKAQLVRDIHDRGCDGAHGVEFVPDPV